MKYLAVAYLPKVKYRKIEEMESSEVLPQDPLSSDESIPKLDAEEQKIEQKLSSDFSTSTSSRESSSSSDDGEDESEEESAESSLPSWIDEGSEDDRSEAVVTLEQDIATVAVDLQRIALSDLLSLTRTDLINARHEYDGDHADTMMYQTALYETPENAAEFLQVLNVHVEHEYAPKNQTQLDRGVQTNHLILEVPNDFDSSMRLSDVAVRIFFLQPDGYIHKAVVNELDRVDARTAQVESEMQGADSSIQSIYREELVDLNERQRELEQQLHDLLNSPVIEFRGPQYRNPQFGRGAVEARGRRSPSPSFFRSGFKGKEEVDAYRTDSEEHSNQPLAVQHESERLMASQSSMLFASSDDGELADLLPYEREAILKDLRESGNEAELRESEKRFGLN